MKHIYYIIFLFLITSFNIQAQSSALNRFIRANNLKHAAIGIKVVNAATGETILSHNENTSLIPASTLKLVTTATALEALGKGFTYKTAICHDGRISPLGVLEGNLYIKGAGDPTLGSEFLYADKELFLKQWTATIQTAGIHTIAGNIVALDQCFGYEGVSPYWAWEDLGNYYAAGTYGISVFDNTYRLFLKSGAAGTRPTIVKTEPSLPYLNFNNELKAANNHLDSAYIYGIPFSNERSIRGTIPQNQTSFVIKGDIPDPGLFLAEYSKKYLSGAGIKVGGNASSYRLNPQKPSGLTEMAAFTSKPLEDIIRVVNVRSNNHYAEHIYQTLKQTKGISPAGFWKSRGLDSNALFMLDGSGISPFDAVSAGFLTDLLVYMNLSNSALAFYNSFPYAGKEGTVASFLKNTQLAGKAKVKSGSFRDVQSFAGYIDADGNRYAFTIIVNHFTGSRAVLKKQMEELLLSLF